MLKDVDLDVKMPLGTSKGHNGRGFAMCNKSKDMYVRTDLGFEEEEIDIGGIGIHVMI